jgi:hypothetical protein
MAKINEVARTLFQELRDTQPKHMTTVNSWVNATSEHKNIPIFLTKAAEGEKQAFCVMLKKALTAKDFSAFQATAPAAKEEEPAPAPEPPVEDEPVVEDEPPAPEEEPPTPPKADEKTNPEPVVEDEQEPEVKPHSPAALDADEASTDMVHAIKSLIEAQIDARPQPKAVAASESVSEDRIREIIQEEMKGMKKDMLKSLSALL